MTLNIVIGSFCSYQLDMATLVLIPESCSSQLVEIHFIVRYEQRARLRLK